MPTYDFECKACRTAFELRASLAEYAALLKEQKIACPACGVTKVTRVFTPPNLGSARASAAPASHHCGPGCNCR